MQRKASSINAAAWNPFEAILERLERIEALLATSTANEAFTTKNPPPGMSRRRFNEVCRSLYERGDERVRKFGRCWSAEPEVLAPAPAKSIAPVTSKSPWSPESALAAAGICPQRARPAGRR